MNKLLHKAHRGKLSKRRTATVNDLRDFPKIGIHQDIYSKAVFLSNSRFEVSESEAVDLIKSKFYESAQRRNLQEGEVENAVRKAFNSGCSARCSNVLDIHHSNKTSDESWNNDLEKLTADSITVGELKDYAKDYLWTVEDMWEDSPFRVDDCLRSKSFHVYIKRMI